MAATRAVDEESSNGFAGHEDERYHDDPNEVDETDTVHPDAPLRRSQGPSADFDDLVHQHHPSWRDNIAQQIPPRLKHAWRATVRWVKGPQPPRIYTIMPFFPKVQHFPLALLDRYAPKTIHRFALLLLIYVSWLLAFSLVLWKSSFSAQIPGYGSPVRLGCQARYWNDGNGCGLNGDQCRPFADARLAFRCPADCGRAQIVNPHAVGDIQVSYRPLVVGGPTSRNLSSSTDASLVSNAVYRGDSFICSSAIHAGFIRDSEGGCGVLTLTGEQPSFPSSSQHGISSIAFPSYFPHSFGFVAGSTATCKDLRWPALIVTVFFTTLLSLFTSSPAIFFWSIFIALFFHVALASDPPALTTYDSLLSIAFGRLLPACFCMWVFYRYAIHRSLSNLTAQIEKTVLWLGPAWVGALNNYTFDRIPIQRLTPHDISAQPGAVPALIIIVLSIFAIALGQAWCFRVEGRMPRYLVVYSLFALGIFAMLAAPGLDLRIHHYILALLFLPGTSFQNRPSLMYQGLLVGLFVNGIARWGFDSILQTPAELFRGINEGTLLPAITVVAVGVRNITFSFGALPVWDPNLKINFDGMSVLVNDVERFRGYADSDEYWDDGITPGQNFTWTWMRHRLGSKYDENDAVNVDEGVDQAEMSTEAKSTVPEYFRFAYMSGSRTGDFSKAGKWDEQGVWHEMQRGPSR